MLYIPITFRTELGLNIFTKCFSQIIINIDKIFPTAISNIKSLSGHFFWKLSD